MSLARTLQIDCSLTADASFSISEDFSTPNDLGPSTEALESVISIAGCWLLVRCGSQYVWRSVRKAIPVERGDGEKWLEKGRRLGTKYWKST